MSSSSPSKHLSYYIKMYVVIFAAFAVVAMVAEEFFIK